MATSLTTPVTSVELFNAFEMKKYPDVYTSLYDSIWGNSNIIEFSTSNYYVEGSPKVTSIAFNRSTLKVSLILSDVRGVLSFHVPGEEDYYELVKYTLNKKICSISRKYSKWNEKKDTIIFNDRISGAGTCSHFFKIDVDVRYTINISKY